MFNNIFFNKIRNVIKTFHLNFLSHSIGIEYLSEEEQEFLKKQFGKKYIEEKKKEIPYLDKIYLIGKIIQKIGLKNINKFDKKELDKILHNNQFPKNLNITEKDLDKIKKQTYLDVLSKQFIIEKDVRQSILNEEIDSRKKGFSIKKILDNLKTKLSNWSDLNDSISYNTENALNQGKADEIKKESGQENPWVYKVPVGDERTCPSCRRQYLNSDGSPKLFKLDELLNNGTNFGLKQIDWKPTLLVLHPNCRCILQYLNIIKGTDIEDYIWNGNIYTLKEDDDNKHKVERESKVNITIGKRTFEV